DKVVCLQHADIDINIKNNDGNTPLHLAATGGCCGCLSWLLTAKNIDVDAKNNNEFNPIDCAVATGHTNCVELLMKVCSRKSSILDEADFKESSQSSHLCISSTHDIPANTKNKQDDVFCSAIKKPNKIYADALSTNTELQINIADDSQYSPSSLTTVNGGDACIERDSQSAHINTQNISEDATNPEVLQCAVSLSHCTITDKSVVKTDVWGNTALHKAAAIGDIEYIWQRLPFMTPDEVNARNNNRETALHKCSLAGHTEFIKCLLTVPGLEINATDVSGNTAVHNAVYANFPECLQLLIDANADTNIDDNYQNTALHYAVDNSRRCISKLIPVMKPERVNFCNKSGFTAFNKAVTRDKKSCISLLLTFSCVDINVQDKHGNTPLHNALIKSSTVSKHSVKILLNKNADVHIRNEGGSTVLHAAVGKKPEFIEQLLQKLDIDFINRKDIKGRTALHRAAAIGDLESIKKLRSAGADILLEDNQGAQAFYSACINGYVEIVRYFLESCKDRNGQHLIDINCQDDFGNTPLYGAGRNGHRDVFSYLIRKGADRTLKNKFGHSPILFDEEKVSKKTLIGLRLPI
ncbi:MAG: ankyrin repeat domain-containing protein, partial [Endozoicomonadaceae bacterium]|nr:ankyrin repeat domain-containing protein [Endozoicomonadaceae bacterium]